VAERLGAQGKAKRTVAPNVIPLPRGQDGTEPNKCLCSSASLYHGDVMQQDAAPAFVVGRALCPQCFPSRIAPARRWRLEIRLQTAQDTLVTLAV
jgi:hypothetical protein